jgi:uncharacterized protein YdhG (YjbR/CyaY superfamily)
MPSHAKTVGEYLARVPPKQRAALKQLRKTIKAVVPDAEEVISYGIPTYKQDGPLISYAAFTNHCSVFGHSGTVLRKFPEVKRFQTSVGTLQFTPDDPIPASFIRKLVKWRLSENQARAAARRKKR